MEAFIVFGLFLILMYGISKIHDTYFHRNDLDKCILPEDETTNSISNQELLSYLSLQAQLKTEWSRENRNIYRRNESLDVLYYDKKIEEEFSNCDEWGWSNNKGEVIEKR